MWREDDGRISEALQNILSEKLAEFFRQSGWSNPPLLTFLIHSDFTCVKLLLCHPSAHRIVNELSPWGGVSPLQYAAKKGWVGVCSMLLERNAEVDHKSAGGMTALHWAVQENQLSVVSLLLQAGANALERASNGLTPLHCVDLRQDCIPTVRQLVQFGADIDDSNEFSQSLLHTSIAAGNIDLALWLASNGANVNFQDVNGQTVLQLAALHGNASLVTDLLHRVAMAGQLDSK